MSEALIKSSINITRAIRRRSWANTHHLRIEGNSQDQTTFKFFTGAIDEELEWKANVVDICADDWEVLDNPPGVVGNLRIDQAICEALKFSPLSRVRRTNWDSSHYLFFCKSEADRLRYYFLIFEHSSLNSDGQKWYPSVEDILASDWQTVESRPKV
jgi:hypothetical protein